MSYATYSRGYQITEAHNQILKDGHTMFTADVIKDLNRKSYLEAENKQLTDSLQRIKNLDIRDDDAPLKANAIASKALSQKAC